MSAPVCDTNGRPYAKLSKLKPGDWLEADAGFTCIDTGEKCQVCSDEHGLFVYCFGETSTPEHHDYAIEQQEADTEHHYLDGQADDGEHLIGFYKIDPPAENS